MTREDGFSRVNGKATRKYAEAAEGALLRRLE
jgi:hypothetical protein